MAWKCAADAHDAGLMVLKTAASDGLEIKFADAAGLEVLTTAGDHLEMRGWCS